MCLMLLVVVPVLILVRLPYCIIQYKRGLFSVDVRRCPVSIVLITDKLFFSFFLSANITLVVINAHINELLKGDMQICMHCML